jgi:hypothetical protein
MRALDTERKWQRIYSQRSAGVYPGEAMSSEANVALAGSETELFLLPEEVQSLGEIQGAGGGFGFMLGFSALGGPDPLL